MLCAGKRSFAICCSSAVPIFTLFSFIKYFAFPSFIENQNFLYSDNKNVKKVCIYKAKKDISVLLFSLNFYKFRGPEFIDSIIW